jgi:hypothetical protein
MTCPNNPNLDISSYDINALKQLLAQQIELSKTLNALMDATQRLSEMKAKYQNIIIAPRPLFAENTEIELDISEILSTIAIFLIIIGMLVQYGPKAFKFTCKVLLTICSKSIHTLYIAFKPKKIPFTLDEKYIKKLLNAQHVTKDDISSFLKTRFDHNHARLGADFWVTFILLCKQQFLYKGYYNIFNVDSKLMDFLTGLLSRKQSALVRRINKAVKAIDEYSELRARMYNWRNRAYSLIVAPNPSLVHDYHQSDMILQLTGAYIRLMLECDIKGLPMTMWHSPKYWFDPECNNTQLEFCLKTKFKLNKLEQIFGVKRKEITWMITHALPASVEEVQCRNCKKQTYVALAEVCDECIETKYPDVNYFCSEKCKRMWWKVEHHAEHLEYDLGLTTFDTN